MALHAVRLQLPSVNNAHPRAATWDSPCGNRPLAFASPFLHSFAQCELRKRGKVANLHSVPTEVDDP
jgi:hypothetical protein